MATATVTVPPYVLGVALPLIKLLKLDNRQMYVWRSGSSLGTLTNIGPSRHNYLFNAIQEHMGMPIADALKILDEWSSAGLFIPDGFTEWRDNHKFDDMTPNDTLRFMALWLIDETITLELEAQGLVSER